MVCRRGLDTPYEGETGNGLVAKSARRKREDVLRWVLGLLLTALLASAATSAVFLSIRNRPAGEEALKQHAASAQQQYKLLAPKLAEAAQARFPAASSPTQTRPTNVGVVFQTGPAKMGQPVPMMSVDGDTLAQGTTVPWRLAITATRPARSFARIVDIRRSTSLVNPGFVGLVELDVKTATSQREISGFLPFQPPDGFQVISQAKYTELSQDSGSNQQVFPASAKPGEVRHRFDDWRPTVPPPADLPPAVQARFHDAVVECLKAQPQVTVEKQTVTFYYSLRDARWSLQP
jgi:hypothetical protein